MTHWRTFAGVIPTCMLVSLGVLPVALGFDYGGQLAWSQYCAALVVLVIALVTILYSLANRHNSDEERGGFHRSSVMSFRRYTSVVVMLLWCGFIAFQTAFLPADIVSRLSPGAAEARAVWLAPIDNTATQLNDVRFPISIDAEMSKRVLAFLLTVPVLIWTALELFRNRKNVQLFLVVTSLAITAQALYGLVCVVLLNIGTGDVPVAPTGFGGFINRNNASLFLGFGIATALGVIISRLPDPSSYDKGIGLSVPVDLESTLRDIFFWIGVTCLSINVVAILACGSRGGLIAMVIGLTCSLACAKGLQRTVRWVLGVILSFVLILIVSLSPSVGLKSIMRLASSNPKVAFAELASTDRLEHWKDGSDAGIEYFPIGSGAGTYGYAYLPYQSSGRELWFQHADNLWLELFVEQGVPGLVFACVFALILMSSTIRLVRSSRLADRAIGCIGVYLLVATAIGQIFDFGLILPANGYAFVLLSAVVVSSVYTANEGVPISAIGRRIRLPKVGAPLIGPRVLCLAMGVFVSTLLMAELPVLRAAAETESIVAHANAAFQGEKMSVARLGERIELMQEQAERHPETQLLTSLSKWQFQIARLIEIENLQASTTEDFDELYNRNRRGYRTLSKVEPEAEQWYRASEMSSIHALQQNPLLIEARAQLAYVDFLHSGQTRQQTVLRQLASLQNRNGPQLMRIATLAAFDGDHSLVEQVLFKATMLDSVHVPDAIDVALRCEGVNLDQSISADPTSRRLAVSYLQKQFNQSEDLGGDLSLFVRQSLEHFRCDECESLVAAAKCERLAAFALLRLDESDEALRRLSIAVELQPANAGLRIEYARYLMRFGRYKDARDVLTRGTRMFPADSRFQALVDKTAKLQSQESRIPMKQNND